MYQTASISVNRASVVFATVDSYVTALRDVSLTVPAGQFVSIVGPSGSGKSTLLRAVGGLVAPGRGDIRVGEMGADEARRARLVSFVFQQPVLLPWYNARQNVELPLRLAHWSAAQRRATAEHFLGLVGLEQFAGAYPWQLSGGMQQRVAIARALSFAPTVLLMDEPFGALDEITRERLNIELLRIWAALRTTVLFVTHSLTEAAFLADRVIVFSAQPGQVIADLRIDLPRPRTIELLSEPMFLERVSMLRQHLHRSYTHHAPLGSASSGYGYYEGE
jgi:NitT/TauT family transport system ATP-binding protein